MGSYFDLLDLADGASGEEAVAKVVSKVVTPNPPKEAKKKKDDPKEAKKKKDDPKDPAQQPQHLGRGRGQGPVGARQDDGYQGGRGRGNIQGHYNGNGNGGYYSNNDNGGYYSNNGNAGYYSNNGNAGYYSNNGDAGYYSNNGDGGYYNNNGDGGYYNNGNGGYYSNNTDRGYYNNNRGYYSHNGDRGYYNDNRGFDQVYYENNGQYHQEVSGGQYSYRYGERQAEGVNHYNGDRQVYSRDGGQSRRKAVHYRPKPASDTASDAEHRPEGKVVPASETKQVDVDAVPASEPEKSAGDVAKDDSKKEGEVVSEKEGDPEEKEGEGDPEKKKKFPNTKSVNGSVKRKLKKQNPKDSNGAKQGAGVEGSKKTTVEPKDMAVMEEIKEMTLEEYEKMREKKSLDSSKSEERKVNPDVFEGLQLLEKKKVEDDARYKGNGQEDENGQPKGKEVKTRKAISINEYLQDYVPPLTRGGFSNGNFRGGRFGGGPPGHGNGGRSRDNSSEPRVYNSGRGDNAIVFHNVGETNGNRAPNGGDGRYQDRRENYNGRFQGRRDGYNNGGGYQQGGRGGGGYQGGRGYRGRGGRGAEAPRPDDASHFPALSVAAPTPAQAQSPARS